MPEALRRTIHYTELPEMSPHDLLRREWDSFRRDLPRLLAEGHEGEFALLRGEELIGLYPSQDDALRAGYDKFLLEPFLVHAIRTEEPLLRISPYCWPCHT